MKIFANSVIIYVIFSNFFLLCVPCIDNPIMCNGSKHLIYKRYNEVAYATTHNSQSYKASCVQNQDKSIQQQLQAGIRAFKMPLWYGCDTLGNKIVCVCHGMSKSFLYDTYEERIHDHVPYIFRNKVKKVATEAKPAIKALRDALRLAYGDTDAQQGLIPFPHGMLDPACEHFQTICGTLKNFLDTNPCEIVTLILEDFTNNVSLIAQAIQESGLQSYAHTQQLNKPWPLLSDMLKKGKRLVIFVRTQDEISLKQYPWLCFLWDYAWDTGFKFSRMADFKDDVVPYRGCQAYEDRNKFPHNKLFIVYHFITPFAGGSKKWAMRVNHHAILKKRINKLTKQTGHMPNFIQVDFFEYPHNDIFKVVNELNLN